MSQIGALCGKPRSGGEEMDLKGCEDPLGYCVSQDSEWPSVQVMILVGASRAAAARK
jgi:hypothetical protein